MNEETPHLFLHFDVNETILLGDPAGGDSVEECVNKIIAKSAFVSTKSNNNCDDNDDHIRSQGGDIKGGAVIKRSPSSGNIGDTHQFEPTHWWNGEAIEDPTISAPPLHTGWEYPPDACPYYRTNFKKHAKRFTLSSHGQVYRPLYEEVCSKIGLDTSNVAGGECLDSSASVFQNFLPAFWITLMFYFPSTLSYNNEMDLLSSLAKDRRLPPPPKVTLVLRTFGTDLPRVAAAISEFAKGNHPDYPNYRNEDLVLEDGDLYRSNWSYRKSSNDVKDELVYSLHRANDQESVTPIHSGDEDILNFLQTKSIVGIQDNYPFWRDNNYAPWSGKPVWINTTVSGRKHHHVLLDDNIHNDPLDGAGGIRAVMNDEGDSSSKVCCYESLPGGKALELHGRHLIRVPTIRPTLEDDWFIKQIEMARWLTKYSKEKDCQKYTLQDSC